MNKPNRSKAIRNLKTATKSTLRTTGNITSKGLNKTAKWLVTDHTNSTQRSSIMELEQTANYYISSVKLTNRRTQRSMKSYQRFKDTGLLDSRLDIAIGWMTDYSLYVLELLWGFIWPIVMNLLMTILIAVAIAILNVIFFYALFKFLFS